MVIKQYRCMIYHYNPIKYYHTYGPNPPALNVSPGDTVVATTVDAGGLDHEGKPIAAEMRQSSPDTVYNNSNPLTGPIYVEGSEPGDTLSIEITKIKLNRASAWSRV
ncbi:hypothetical protein E2P71_09140, partial [Candidatus Bathyarchaeota archaeon]